MVKSMQEAGVEAPDDWKIVKAKVRIERKMGALLSEFV